MELVSARLGLHRDHHARIAAIFGVEAALKHAKLRDAIDARLRVLRLVVADIDIRRPVEIKVILGASSAEGMKLRNVVEVDIEIVLRGTGHSRNGIH